MALGLAVLLTAPWAPPALQPRTLLNAPPLDKPGSKQHLGSEGLFSECIKFTRAVEKQAPSRKQEKQQSKKQ
jgi:hypothetical protein